MQLRWSPLAGVLIFGLSMAMPTLADATVDREVALEKSFQELVERAQAAFEAEEYEAAIDYLVLARRERPEPTLFLNIARSYEELDQCHRQLAYYRAFLDHPERDEQLDERAETAIEKIGPECDKDRDDRTGRIAFESSPPLATVYLDDEAVGRTPVEIVAVEAGPRTIRFELEGYRDEVLDETFEPGEGPVELDVELRQHDEEQPDIALDDDPPPGDDQPTDAGFSPNPFALTITGVGLGAAATGVILDAWTIPRIDDRREQARLDGDRARLEDLTETRRNVAAGALVGYIAGGLLVAGGLGWVGYDYYRHDRDESPPPVGLRVHPGFGTDGGGELTVFGRF